MTSKPANALKAASAKKVAANPPAPAPAPAPAPEAQAPAAEGEGQPTGDPAPAADDQHEGEDEALTVEGEDGKKKKYKTREEVVAYWQARIDKVKADADEKVARYQKFLDTANKPRQRQHVKDEEVDAVLSTMSEEDIKKQRAIFEAALRRAKQNKPAEGEGGGEALAPAPAPEATATTA
jgi:hypothetical protein